MIQPTNHNRAGRLLLVVAMLLALLAGSSSGAAASETTDEAQFVTLINELRSARGLPALEVHTQLAPPSRDWAAQMASTGTLAHAPDLSVGVTAYWIKLGENVGVAPQGQIQQLFNAFVARPAHLQNLVDPQFCKQGVVGSNPIVSTSKCNGSSGGGECHTSVNQPAISSHRAVLS
ncbi:MAG: CAP domain-containing protein [Actinomycetota bacterium]|nr:CAP domain-containing protein [Actinomycetota bacterium]